MKISIIGSGWVGENTGKGLINLGHEVTFHDISNERVEELKDEGLKATESLERAVLNTEVSFICVPTPTKDGSIDLDYLKSASRKIGSHLKEKEGYHLVVVKSTVVPGTTGGLVIPEIEEESGKNAGDGFGVCMNPEFMTEISDSWTGEEGFEKGFSSDRIVIGQYDDKSGDKLEELYEELEIPIVKTGLREAEMIKYASNCMLATKISYWNQIFKICRKLDIDSDEVAQAVAMDPRIGEYGTVHGKAFGGKCLPKDLRALIAFAEDRAGEEPELLKAVEDINEYMAEEYGVRE